MWEKTSTPFTPLLDESKNQKKKIHRLCLNVIHLQFRDSYKFPADETKE